MCCVYIKPDITAPGVEIIAASTESRHALDSTPFTMLEGTSMSCPHVAGVVALLKAIHPDWTTAAIKSAIMTTGTNPASQNSLIEECHHLFLLLIMLNAKLASNKSRLST